MSHTRKKFGNWGEDVAIAHLEANGFKIKTRNWHCQLGEIDIVATKWNHQYQETLLHFVEVKTRKGNSGGAPEESLTFSKRKKLMHAALLYLSRHNITTLDWQIDLMAIELDRKGKLVRCELVENVVQG